MLLFYTHFYVQTYVILPYLGGNDRKHGIYITLFGYVFGMNLFLHSMD